MGNAAGKPKNDSEKPKKYEKHKISQTYSRKKNKSYRGSENTLLKMPEIYPVTKCKLRQLRMERVKDYLLIQKEHAQRQEAIHVKERSKGKDRFAQLRGLVDKIRGDSMLVGSLEEIIDENHAIVSTNIGLKYYSNIMSFVDRDLAEPGSSVLLHAKTMSVLGVLPATATGASLMQMDKTPLETYADVGGLEKQIQEVKEAVELPMTHPELYDDIGITPPKGVIFYGLPGTGKTLLAKAVARETSATFLHMVGSELIQKYLGDGPKLVRELFKTAEAHAPAIIFIDEIDAVGSKRYSSNSGGTREVQRTMLELLNQLDGFDARGDIKVIMATNRISSLDPALLRPGRIDRKIEFTLPDVATRRKIFAVHTARMQLSPDVDVEALVTSKDDLSGADIKAICSEAGLLALRARRMRVERADFEKAKETALYRKKAGIPEGLYL